MLYKRKAIDVFKTWIWHYREDSELFLFLPCTASKRCHLDRPAYFVCPGNPQSKAKYEVETYLKFTYHENGINYIRVESLIIHHNKRSKKGVPI